MLGGVDLRRAALFARNLAMLGIIIAAGAKP
jgi:hypothetical protein